ncbi:uncharacterized protein DUF2802 [Azonexus fungiphilus]|uniref:Uncharacterized protein DUF2802 n=1 Tax=Azonexus fungiphilus TaxID=146940 RepID=A0A495WAN3_9RHOO|nr:DUF2802 domain-containing protein [Azonexus fungiphilus]RKT58766.1 uncharacterized protein DUF2802 [Azonexus fungiphilus]
MFGAGLPSFAIAGLTVGVREAVLVLIILVALYIGVVLWRMRHLGRPPTASASREAPVIAPEPAAAEAASASEAAPEAAAFAQTSARLGSELINDGLARELAQLREEVDVMRGELAALRTDMLQELAHLRATQTVSPIYGDAMQMAVAGYDAATIAERCGIARAEAELVVALARSQVQ